MGKPNDSSPLWRDLASDKSLLFPFQTYIVWFLASQQEFWQLSIALIAGENPMQDDWYAICISDYLLQVQAPTARMLCNIDLFCLLTEAVRLLSVQAYPPCFVPLS